MSRKKSIGKLVETVEHGPFKARICMDARSGVFFCDYADTHKSGTLPEVRDWARNILRSTSNVQWQPVIRVRSCDSDWMINGSMKLHAHITIDAERHWIAWVGAKWVICPWIVQPAGTVVCTSHSPSEMQQPKMSETELMAQRLAYSKEWHVVHTQDFVWPIKGEWMQRDNVYWVPHTELAWATILAIMERVKELRSKLDSLMGSAKGWNTLASIAGTKLLEAPKQGHDDQ